MNIQTATGYARHGYPIYRNAWRHRDNAASWLQLTVAPNNNKHALYMCSEDEFYVLTPEDCLADDWAIIT